MKYYITYRLEEDPKLNIAGPYSEFEYTYKSMEILAANSVYDLDIVNEFAMEFYFINQKIKAEYENAKRQLIENPGCIEWTLEDQVQAKRSYDSFTEEDWSMLQTTLTESEEQAVDTVDLIEDPYDYSF